MDLSLGSARPMLAAMRRCASLVEFSTMTVNATARASYAQPFAARNQFAVGRKDGGDADDIACRNARVPEGELKARKSFKMFTDAFGGKIFLATNAMCRFLPCLRD